MSEWASGLRIGPCALPNRVILAPMAGVTDLPYRNLCRAHGAGAAVAEMLIADQALWGKGKGRLRGVLPQETGLRWIQILGNDPQQMAEAARACETAGAHLIDLNMGCPAKKVCRKAAGSALLQDAPLVGRILEAVVQAVQVPVTLKIRTGPHTGWRNAVAIARLAESAGVAALSLHGRTRACRYEVPAEHDTATAVRQAMAIPLIVNGDITTPQQARQVLQATGADAVMIGRAALGNPWLFRQTSHYLATGEILPPPDQYTVQACLREHVASLHDFYGPVQGVRIARKHVGWYEAQFPHWLSVRQVFNTLSSCEAQRDFLNASFTGGQTHAHAAYHDPCRAA